MRCLGEVFDINLAIVSEAAVDGQESLLHTFDFKALEQLAREMEAGSGDNHCSLSGGEDGLIAFCILGFGFALDVIGEGGVAEFVKRLLEFVVRAVIEETQSAASRSGVVDNFGNHRLVIAEVKFVADADLSGRFDENVPQLVFSVKLAQEEYLDARACFFFVAVEARREDHSVVEHHQVTVDKVVYNFFEHMMLDRTVGTVDDHEA